MEALLDATRPAPGVVATLMLLGVWAASLAGPMLAAVIYFAVNPNVSWRQYSDPKERYSVELPAEPFDLPPLKAKTPTGEVDTDAIHAIVGVRGSYTVRTFKVQGPLDGARIDAYFDLEQAEFADRARGAVSAREVTMSGTRARELVVDQGDVVERIFAVGDRFFVLGLVSKDAAAIERFFNSFKPAPPALTID
jgi:hypothetical protein